MAQAPTSHLHDLVLDLNWSQMERHVLQYPLDAQYRSADANETPLYLALEIGFPPVSTVQALLRAYPEAAILPQTKNRDLPIHLVCRFGQTTIKYAILKALLMDINNASNGIQGHKQFLPSVHANARSRYGHTPLSALADSFLAWCQESKTTATIQSINRVKREHWKCVHLVLQAACGYLDNHQNKSIPDNNNDRSIITTGLDNSSFFLPVHSALKLGVTHDCPYHVVMLVIEMCNVNHFTIPDHSSLLFLPQQQHHNCHGQLPIHIAISNAKSAFKTEEDYHSILCAIIDKYPMAASIKDPWTKSYPLHLALSSSYDNTPQAPTADIRTSVIPTTSILPLQRSKKRLEVLPWEPVLKKLCMAFPDAVEQPDLYTTLFPFAMVALQAAVATDHCTNELIQNTDEKRKHHNKDVTILTTIYELLQMKPHVLSHYCYL
jgi:hypothetical protein